jgi:TrmH family RNA methyltransferase
MGSSSKPALRRGAPQPEALITSRDNRWLKRFRACLAGEDASDELIGVEGMRLVEAALGAGLPVQALLVSESGDRHFSGMAAALTPGIRILRTTDRLFAAVAVTVAPQGVAALVRPKTASVEDVLRGLPLVVVLAGVQDPGNVGTILRAAEAFGATGAATCAAAGIGIANPMAPKALRSSAGAALRLPILRGVSFPIFTAQMRVSGVKVYAAVPDAQPRTNSAGQTGLRTLLPWEVDWRSPAALLIGNEGAGLPSEIVGAAVAMVSIPREQAPAAPGADSLNAAMAATVLLYEAMRQRARLE